MSMRTMTVDHPDVREIVAFEHEGELIAVVVPRSYASAVDIREHLWKRFGDASPTLVALLEELPTSTDGAVDLATLGARVNSLDHAQVSRYVEASGEVEKRLVALVGEVLQIERIGALDDFIELGGTSIHMVRLSTLITERCDVEVTLEEVFDATSVRGLAKIVETRS